MNRSPWLTLAVVAAALAVFFLPGAAELLEYRRSGVASGELWRLLTGHLAHWNAEHLLWNVAAFAILGSLAEARGRRRTVGALLASAVAVSAAVWLGLPGMAGYRWLSGVASALFVAVAVDVGRAGWARGDRRAAAVALAAGAAFIGRAVWEVATGTALFAGGKEFVTVPLAHLVGGAVGLALSVAPRFPQRQTFPPPAGSAGFQPAP